MLNFGSFAHFMQLCPSVSEEHQHEMKNYICLILDNTAHLTACQIAKPYTRRFTFDIDVESTLLE